MECGSFCVCGVLDDYFRVSHTPNRRSRPLSSIHLLPSKVTSTPLSLPHPTDALSPSPAVLLVVPLLLRRPQDPRHCLLVSFSPTYSPGLCLVNTHSVHLYLLFTVRCPFASSSTRPPVSLRWVAHCPCPHASMLFRLAKEEIIFLRRFISRSDTFGEVLGLTDTVNFSVLTPP